MAERMLFAAVGGLDTEMPDLLSADGGAWACFWTRRPPTLFPFSHLEVSEMDEVLSEALFWELERSNSHLIWDMLTVHFFFFFLFFSSPGTRCKQVRNKNTKKQVKSQTGESVFPRCDEERDAPGLTLAVLWEQCRVILTS